MELGLGRSLLVTDKDITDVVGAEMFECCSREPVHTGRSWPLRGCFPEGAGNISGTGKPENCAQIESASAVILN